jgi:signal transduction histidine kinase
MDPREPLFELDLATTLEVLASGAMVFDQRGKLLMANQRCLNMLGFQSLAELIDEHDGRTRRIRILSMDGLPMAHPQRLVQRALAGKTLVVDFERIDQCDGRPQMIFRVDVSPLLDRTGRVIGAIKLIRDVSTEYELTRRRHEFVRVAMHELRTPTTVLRLHAQRLLQAEAPWPPPVRGSVEAVDRATRRIETLSVKLEDIATVAAGLPIPIQPSTLHLDALVADVVQSLRPEQAARVQMRAAPAQVWADRTRLREVLEALLDNALRYSDAPATVGVEVDQHDGQVELSVADHGIGIPEAKQSHVFEQFYRAHVDTPFDRGGLGASLFLANQIMKEHGGRIWFESKERQGSVFHLALRATPPAGASSGPDVSEQKENLPSGPFLGQLLRRSDLR